MSRGNGNGNGNRKAHLIGDSKPMRGLRARIATLAPLDLPVLIEGETGTGKELVARALHEASGRRGRFVAVNVCAIPETMFEATLFGHVKGAFTGASYPSRGLLAEADGGTLFLDEIALLPLALQPKLLRAIESREFRPVGAGAERSSDFRVVSASNEPLDIAVAAGRFRGDLLYRVKVAALRVPPLRERKQDIPSLAQRFLAEVNSNGAPFAPCALEALTRHRWPGNVRELRNLVLRLAGEAGGAVITADAVHEALRDANRSSGDHPGRDRLLRLMTGVGGDVRLAARAEGVHLSTMYRRLARLGIR